jgi:Sec-independent protein secretion pathway component TatC
MVGHLRRVAGPLFIGGVLLGFFVLPKGLGILLDFTPTDVSNFVNLDKYLTFIMRMLLVFGVSFEIPLFVILLNLAGVVSGKSLGSTARGSSSASSCSPLSLPPPPTRSACCSSPYR